MKKRRLGSFSLVLVPLLLAGCSEGLDETTQRDVYTRFEDCMADWGKPELCQQMQEADAKQFAQQTTGVAGDNGSHLIFWGPQYYPGSRSVGFNGQTYTPTTNRAMSRPFAITSTSSPASRVSTSSPAPRASSVASSGVARSGFGGSARASSVSSGGG